MNAMAETDPVVLFGPLGGDHVSIKVLRRAHPDATDNWDANWLISPVQIRVGGFDATIDRAMLRSDELLDFRIGLEALYRLEPGEAHLHSLEGWLDLTVVLDSGGHLAIEGEATDHLSRLSFRLGELDQSDMPEPLSALREVERRYPVLGRPS